MKKQHLFSVVLLATVFIFASCAKVVDAKKMSLVTQEDSINYAIAVVNADMVKTSVNDSILPQMLKAMDKAYNGDAEKDGPYNYGQYLGSMIKQMKKTGLMDRPELKFDSNIFMQGFINGLKSFNEGMTVAEANDLLQTTMTQGMDIQPEELPAEPVLEAQGE